VSRLDNFIESAVARQDAPFAVAVVADRHGVLWEGHAGQANAARAAGPDTVFRLFSQTKAIGTLGAMILVDRGLLSLETPVASVLPDFDDIQVLESFGPGGPVFRAPRTTATLRHLLTHTSGFAYPSCDALMAAYAEQVPDMPGILAGTLESLNVPLMFDPGQGWTYGTGIDWAGCMVPAVDGRGIERFYREEILDPLGMHDTVFEVSPVRERLADVKQRSEDGGFTDIVHELPMLPEVYGMGQALHGTAPDYIRFLRMVLNQGELDGHRFLSKPTFELMTTNQIGDMNVPPLPTCIPWLTDVVDPFPGTRKTHTAGFLRLEEDIPGMRSAGSLGWAGVMNSHYWIDPAQDVAAVFMTQAFPFFEPRFMNAYAQFERLVYQELPRLRAHRTTGHDDARTPNESDSMPTALGTKDLAGSG
jgi:methyl acetate hydrolase